MKRDGPSHARIDRAALLIAALVLSAGYVALLAGLVLLAMEAFAAPSVGRSFLMFGGALGGVALVVSHVDDLMRATARCWREGGE